MHRNLNRDIYVDAEERRQIIAKNRPLGAVDGAPAHWRTRDGRQLTVEIYGHITETEGRESFDAWVLDVTRREAEREELVRTAQFLALVVRQVPAIYWRGDRDVR